VFFCVGGCTVVSFAEGDLVFAAGIKNFIPIRNVSKLSRDERYRWLEVLATKRAVITTKFHAQV
jgi:hypothetical protein